MSSGVEREDAADELRLVRVHDPPVRGPDLDPREGAEQDLVADEAVERGDRAGVPAHETAAHRGLDDAMSDELGHPPSVA